MVSEKAFSQNQRFQDFYGMIAVELAEIASDGIFRTISEILVINVVSQFMKNSILATLLV